MVTGTFERALQKEILAQDTSCLDTPAEDDVLPRNKRHKKCVFYMLLLRYLWFLPTSLYCPGSG